MRLLQHVHETTNDKQKTESHATLHHHTTTFTQWHQLLHVLIWTPKLSPQMSSYKEKVSVWNFHRQPRFNLINYSSNIFCLQSWNLFHPPTFEHGWIHHNLRTNTNNHHAVFHRLFIHHDLLIEYQTLSNLFSIFNVPNRELSCSQPTNSFNSSPQKFLASSSRYPSNTSLIVRILRPSIS